MYIVLVCGGRDYTDTARVFKELDYIHAEEGPITAIVCGLAKGADERAQLWAYERGVEVRGYPAHWGRYGRAAGPLRNQQMLDNEDINRGVAFAGGRGTDDMVGRMTAAGIPVRSIP